MDKDLLSIILILNESAQIVAHAAENALYMKKSLERDNTNTEYKDKLQRMRYEIPYIITRANALRLAVEEFNRIAMA